MNALHSPTRRGLQPGSHSRLSTPMRLALRCAAGVALSTALSTALALKVDMYAIGNWSGGNCAPGDTDANRGSWPGMANAWYDWMGNMGNSKTGKFVDGNMTVNQWALTNPNQYIAYLVDGSGVVSRIAIGYRGADNSITLPPPC